jgi:di/tricarboxylate transporter
MTETLGITPGGRASTRLAISMFTGASLMSAVFLSSKSINFVVLGLLPAQTQLQFQWLHWLFSSLATGIGMLLVYLVLSAIMLRNNEKQSLSAELIKTQLQLLGELKNRERLAIAGMALFAVGVVTSAFHKIEPVWIGLGVLLVFLLIGTLNKREFREKIDWPFLFYLAETIGIINVFNYVGLNTWISKGLSAIGLERLLATNLPIFILALTGIILLMRFLLPINATVVILATIFIPLADNIGFNTWVMGFIILLLGEMWIFPYQCSYYVQFRSLTKKFALYDEQTFLQFNLWSNILKIAVVYLSIPFWKLLGFL